MAPEQAKMQACIMASHSATKAQASRDHHQRCKSAAGMETNQFQFDWDEKDMQSGGLGKFGIDVHAQMVVARPIIYFRNWVEPWEDQLRNTDGPVVEAKFLGKYGDQRLWDMDNEVVLTINPDQMYFIRSRSKNISEYEKGWQAVACKAGFDMTQEMDSPANKHLWEPWVLSEEMVHDMIAEYQKRFPDKCLKLITKEEHKKSQKDPPPVRPLVVQVPVPAQVTAEAQQRWATALGKTMEKTTSKRAATRKAAMRRTTKKTPLRRTLTTPAKPGQRTPEKREEGGASDAVGTSARQA